MSQLSYSAATMVASKAGPSLPTVGEDEARDYSVEEKHDHQDKNRNPGSNHAATMTTQGSYDVKISSVSGSYGVSGSNEVGNYNAEEVDEEEDYDEDDEDYDVEFDMDDYGDNDTPSAAMSESLMIALGLDVTNRPKVESDWKPPSHSGLDYSARKSCIHNLVCRLDASVYDYPLFHLLLQQSFQQNSMVAPFAE